MFNIIFSLLIILAFASGIFDIVDWKFNAPAIAFLAVAWLVTAYNIFVRLGQRVKEAWADIDVQLKRRYDLIPNLVNTVKGYASHEQKTFEMVTEARTKAMTAGTVAEHAEAENMLSGALKSIFALSEAYPDLKANQNFLELQKEISDTENKIQAARRFYNGNVREMNTMIHLFPNNIMARLFGFGEQEYFELSENKEQREPVKVEF
jgi:LemA protein